MWQCIYCIPCAFLRNCVNNTIYLHFSSFRKVNDNAHLTYSMSVLFLVVCHCPCVCVGVCVCCRGFVQQCQCCESAASADSAHRANASLDRVVNLGVRLLSDRLFEHIRVSFTSMI